MNRKLAFIVILGFSLVLAVSLFAQQWSYVGTLSSDASKDESAVVIDASQPIEVGRDLLIEERDTGIQQQLRVKHVYGRHILFYETLAQPFTAGSKVFQ